MSFVETARVLIEDDMEYIIRLIMINLNFENVGRGRDEVVQN